MTKKLAVIGGGPKAAAIAAKAYCLEKEGCEPPEVTIYCEFGVGSMWTGQHGYTDGLQSLCTPAERDLGFPYDTSAPTLAVAERMMGEFSWHRFLVRGLGASSYEDWVVSRKRPPAHGEFAGYLRDGVGRTGATIVVGGVLSVDHDGSQWCVECSVSGSSDTRLFDGVVITGIGPSLRGIPGANGRVFDSHNFWLNLPGVRKLIDDAKPDDAEVAIIGGGGTAAAVAQWFVENYRRREHFRTTIVGHEATLFMRTANVFEDRLFSDETEWEHLAFHTRARFLERLTRAAVWEPVIRSLEGEANLTYKSAHVHRFSNAGPDLSGGPDELLAELAEPPDRHSASGRSPPLVPIGSVAATLFVDARGFNPWWWVGLLPAHSRLRNHFVTGNHDNVMKGIDRHLSVGATGIQGDPFPPGLHLPNIATYQGPAASNLMALGWLSDRILRPYLGSLAPFGAMLGTAP